MLFLESNRNKRFVVLYGGASSSKSWQLAAYLLLNKFLVESNIGILILRKTKPAVRSSCYDLILSWLNKFQMRYNENKSLWRIYGPHNNFIAFDGLDDVEKKKSIEGINYIWVEEATEITHKEFIQLNLRCRARNYNGINQLFLTFNPVDPIENEWLKRFTENPPEDMAVMQFTYKDNPFLGIEERKQIEELIEVDEEFAAIYNHGEWAVPKNRIYTNWKLIDKMPEEFEEHVWGLDFGYSSNPAALIEIRTRGGNEIYEKEHIYQSKLTNDDLIVMLKDKMETTNDLIIADSAEPKSIQEIRNAGYNIQPCEKGPDSVRHGINLIRSLKVFITRDSQNLIAEKKTYKWKEDKVGNPTSEPVKFKDHLLDAERYAVQKIKGRVKAGISYLDIIGTDIDEDDEW